MTGQRGSMLSSGMRLAFVDLVTLRCWGLRRRRYKGFSFCTLHEIHRNLCWQKWGEAVACAAGGTFASIDLGMFNKFINQKNATVLMEASNFQTRLVVQLVVTSTI